MAENQMYLSNFSISQLLTTLISILGRDTAYLDPGSGSYFIQLVLASLMGALFILGIYRRKVTDFFRNLFSKRKPDEDNGE
jgi:hypothetical protein